MLDRSDQFPQFASPLSARRLCWLQSIALLLSTAFTSILAGTTPRSEPPVKHVIVLGLDGVSSDGLARAKTPHLDALRKAGASTLAARAVMPTASGPNWASILMGAGPEQHGVTSNDWRPDKFDLSPTDVGPGGIFPTIFSLLHQARPDLKTAAIYDWGGTSLYFERDLVDLDFEPDLPKSTTEERVLRAEATLDRAIACIAGQEAQFIFIQLDHPDHFGHRFSWGSDEYLASIEHADGLVGKLLVAVDEAGITSSTALIVVSDHGGIDKGHGGATDAEILVPWILQAPGIRPNFDLGPHLSVCDTAPTIAYLLGVQPPRSWTGRPPFDAFFPSPPQE